MPRTIGWSFGHSGIVKIQWGQARSPARGGSLQRTLRPSTNVSLYKTDHPSGTIGAIGAWGVWLRGSFATGRGTPPTQQQWLRRSQIPVRGSTGVGRPRLWCRPPTEPTMLRYDCASAYRGFSLWLDRIACESLSQSAVDWRLTVCNWRTTFIVRLFSCFSFGWPRYGPSWCRLATCPVRSLRPSGSHYRSMQTLRFGSAKRAPRWRCCGDSRS